MRFVVMHPAKIVFTICFIIHYFLTFNDFILRQTGHTLFSEFLFYRHLRSHHFHPDAELEHYSLHALVVMILSEPLYVCVNCMSDFNYQEDLDAFINNVIVFIRIFHTNKYCRTNEAEPVYIVA